MVGCLDVRVEVGADLLDFDGSVIGGPVAWSGRVGLVGESGYVRNPDVKAG